MQNIILRTSGLLVVFGVEGTLSPGQCRLHPGSPQAGVPSHSVQYLG